MSSITAGTSAGTALVHTADTSGSLLLKTGSSATTALTLDSSQNATFAGSVTAPSFSGTSTTATNLEGGSLGTIPYQYASGATTMLATGTTGQFLTSNGVAAPSWTTPATPVTSTFQEITSSTTWTKPANTNFVMVEAWGAGAGGATGSNATANGGGGGSYTQRLFKASDLTSTVAVAIGAGGTAGGGTGGNTTFGSYLTSYGGSGTTGAGVLSGGSPILYNITDASTNTYGGFSQTGVTGQSNGFGGGAGNGGTSYQGGGGGGSSGATTGNQGGAGQNYSGGVRGFYGLAPTSPAYFGGGGGGSGSGSRTTYNQTTTMSYANGNFIATPANSNTQPFVWVGSAVNGNTDLFTTYLTPSGVDLYLYGAIYGNSVYLFWSPNNANWYTTTNFTSYTAVTRTYTANNGYNSVTFLSGYFYGSGTDGVVYRSSDLITWTAVNTPGVSSSSHYVTLAGTTLISAYTTGSLLEIWTSTNGTSWTKVNSTSTSAKIGALAATASLLIIGTQSSPYGYYSTTNGATITAISGPTSYASVSVPNTICIAGNNVLYIQQAGGTYAISTNGGVSFTVTTGVSWSLNSCATNGTQWASNYNIGSDSNRTIAVSSAVGSALTTWNPTAAAYSWTGTSGAAGGVGGGGGGASYTSGFTGGEGGSGMIRVYTW